MKNVEPKGKDRYQQVIPFKGKSMFPLLKEGDKVVVNLFSQPQKMDDTLRGKVCLYNDGSEWVVHRVLWREDTHFIKGDFAKAHAKDTGTLIWGEVESVLLPSGKTICFRDSKNYNSWAERFSLYHLKGPLIVSKISKFGLYLLNIIKRYS